MTNPGFTAATNFLLPHFDHPVLNNLWTAKDKGEEFIFKRFTPEESRSFHEHIFEHSDFKDISRALKIIVWRQTIMPHPLHTKESAIFINDYSGNNLTTDEINNLNRFCKSF